MSVYPPLYWTPRVILKTTLITMAQLAADRYAIGRGLVCAVCEEESGKRNPSVPGGVEDWDPNAVRFERAFEERYVRPPNPAMPTTEELCLAMSYGLMQIMGLTARENGFNGKFLTALCDPETGIEFGCRKLRRCIDASNSDPAAALLRWNGGADKAYPSRVMARMAKYS